MSDADILASMPSPAEPFSSFLDLQTEHDRVLGQQDEIDNFTDIEKLTFWQEIQHFVARIEATGAMLDLSRDRRVAQSILNYWSSYLYRAGYPVSELRLAEFDPALAPELPDSPRPYAGLDAFGEDKHEFFFGREALVAEMLKRLENGERLVALVGASGSGKSSIVLCGLLAKLKAGALSGSEDWHYLTIVPGTEPATNLHNALLSVGPPSDQLVENGVGIPEAAARNEQNVLQAVINIVRERYPGVFVLIVDQFEELFTLCKNEEEKHSFTQQIIALTQTPDLPYIVIVTMRTDFADNVVRMPEFLPLFRAARLDVEALDIHQLRAAIEQPAFKVGLRFEEGIVDDLIAKILGERAGLPLLQFTLLKLWENRRRNRITQDVYALVGDPLQALERSAEKFYSQLLPEEQNTVKHLFLKLVRLAEGREVTSQRIPIANAFSDGEASDRVEHVLYRLICEERLLKVSGKRSHQNLNICANRNAFTQQLTNVASGTEIIQVEIAHEALIRNWPRLVEWLEDEHVKFRRRLRITEAARQWAVLGYNSGALYSALLLAEARRVIEESNTPLTAQERDFLEASQHLIEQVHNQEIARQVELIHAQEKATQQERRTQRLRWLVIALVIVAFIPILITAIELHLRTSPWAFVENLPRGYVTVIDYAPGPPQHPSPRYCIGTVKFGVACSTDGKTWNILQQNLPTGGLANASEMSLRGVNALAIDAVNTDHIYVFLWGKGIFKSSDGGVSWESANMTLPQDEVKKLVAHDGVVAAVIGNEQADEYHLYVTLDAGNQWALVADANLVPIGKVYDVLLIESDNAAASLYLVVATDTGLYRSRVGSVWSWQQLAAVDHVRLVAKGNSLNEGIYFSTWMKDKSQSSLYFWQQEQRTKPITHFDSKIRKLSAIAHPDSQVTAYALLSSNESWHVDLTGEKQSLGRPATSLFTGSTNYAYDLRAVLNPQRDGFWLLLGHTDGLLFQQAP